MRSEYGPSASWLSRAWQATLVVLATALVARIAWELLKPLVPGLIAALALIGIVSFAVSGRRYR